MKIKGFTPIFDSLAQKYDPYTALVYGKIWRICDWSEMGVCTMANDKIAAQIGLSEKTIRRKKELLQEDGLIKVVGKTGMTDTVAVCHEVVMRMELEYSADSGGSSVDSVSKNTDWESYKDSIDSNRKNTGESLKSGIKESQRIQADFQKHLGLTPNWDTKTNQQHYQFFRERYQDKQTAGQFARWWYTEDWRGQSGQPPTFNQVRDQWFQAFDTIRNQEQTQYRKAK